jgi:hypothetical protein
MAVEKGVAIWSVLVMPKGKACVPNMEQKGNFVAIMNAPSLLSGMAFAVVMVESATAPFLNVESLCFRPGSAIFTSTTRWPHLQPTALQQRQMQ